MKDREDDDPIPLPTVADVVGKALDGHAPDVSVNDRRKVGMFGDDFWTAVDLRDEFDTEIDRSFLVPEGCFV